MHAGAIFRNYTSFCNLDLNLSCYSSKDTLEFKIFQTKRQKLNKNMNITRLPDHKNHSNVRMKTDKCLQSVLKKENWSRPPQDEYQEACELATVISSVQPASWGNHQHWRSSSAFGGARWWPNFYMHRKLRLLLNRWLSWMMNSSLSYRSPWYLFHMNTLNFG